MSSPLNLGQIGDFTNRAIQNIWKKEAKNELQLKQYYNFRTTDERYEKDSSISGLKEADFTDENAEIMEDVPIQGYDQSYEQQSHDIIVPLTFMVWKFGFSKRKLTNIAGQIDRALNREKEKLAAERLTNGFNSSYTHQGPAKNTSITLTGGDGVEPWSTAHTREDGGTNINNVVYDGTTYSLAFDYAGYKAACRTASLIVDPRGNPDAPNLNTLICKKGSSVHFKAMEILGAIKKGMIPESNDNDASALPAFKIIANEFLTQDAYWGMFDSSRALTDEYGFQHIESESNKLYPVNIVYKTNEMQFKGGSIYRQGFNDVARAWVWSAGDGSTT